MVGLTETQEHTRDGANSPFKSSCLKIADYYKSKESKIDVASARRIKFLNDIRQVTNAFTLAYGSKRKRTAQKVIDDIIKSSSTIKVLLQTN